MWPKHKDSQVRINRENQANDSNSWLILSSKGESEKCSAFLVKLCKAKSFIILFKALDIIKPQGQTSLKNSVLGKFFVFTFFQNMRPIQSFLSPNFARKSKSKVCFQLQCHLCPPANKASMLSLLLPPISVLWSFI